MEEAYEAAVKQLEQQAGAPALAIKQAENIIEELENSITQANHKI